VQVTPAEARRRLAAVPAGAAVGVAVAPGLLGLAVGDELLRVAGGADVLDGSSARLVWWTGAGTATPLVAQGRRPRSCWDLGAVHRLLTGSRRDDPAAVWAGSLGRAEPPQPDLAPTLLEAAGDGPLTEDGLLAPDYAREDGDPAVRAGLALQVQRAQALALAALPDPRARPVAPPLALLTAYAESAAALLAVELAADGLPLHRETVAALIEAAAGPRPADAAEEQRVRALRDQRVQAAFGGAPVDLRNPASVRELLLTAGIDVPDTRSWRLEPHRTTAPAVAALLEWRKAERISTTYGWGWLDRHVGPDDRLRGSWGAADAAAGRMTASAGLHNLPAELRPAVAAEPGHLLVRADLGQIEPRVLAVVSGDPGLSAAARELDMYAPVAAALGCDRPTAKIAVLAAMYGQTSGTAGAALQRMERAYPAALAYLRAAEETGRVGGSLRTWGGRLLVLPGGGSGRGARNAVVQGAAAELFKVWAATVRAGLASLGGAIVLCLHDELLLHVPAVAAEEAAELLRSALAEASGRWASGSAVRFVADVAVVQRWSDAKG
jgi:DNA polymerase-1